tara:strand:- start:326 stop:487 length:162 start_codon:yes stop_codon:yes gene_type:complete
VLLFAGIAGIVGHFVTTWIAWIVHARVTRMGAILLIGSTIAGVFGLCDGVDNE